MSHVNCPPNHMTEESAAGMRARKAICNQVKASAGQSRSSSSGCGQGVGASKPCGQAGASGKEGGGPGGHQVWHRGQHMQLQQSQQCITTHAAQGGACMIKGFGVSFLLFWHLGFLKCICSCCFGGQSGEEGTPKQSKLAWACCTS